MLSDGPILSRGIRRAATACLATLYVLVYLNAKRLLPEAVFRDAEKIQVQMEGGTAYAGSSFEAVGALFAALGSGLDALVIGIGIWLIRELFRDADRPGKLVAACMLAAPCLFFNLFVASKDTLVVLMTLCIAIPLRRACTWSAWIAMAVLYLGYAAMLRPYFALIVACAVACHVLCRLGNRARIVLIGIGLLAVALVPSAVFFALQHPRDLAVDYLMFQSPYGARSGFHNPFPPTTLFAFAANYVYAVLRLNLALLWNPGIKELAMQCWIVLTVGPPVAMLWAGHGERNAGRHQAACLVIGHIAVSMLFEPDLGSYMRHLSSVAVLSMALLDDE